MSSKKETYLNKVKYNVDKFYFDNHRVTTKENTDEGFPQGEHGLKLNQHKDDKGNIVYSNALYITLIIGKWSLPHTVEPKTVLHLSKKLQQFIRK